MQGIIDILSSDISTVGQSDFVANGAVNDILVNVPPVNGLTFFNARGQFRFALGDNILIQRIWAVVPWGFGQGGPAASPFSHNISLNYWDGAVLTDMPPFPGGSISIPTLCDPLDFGSGVFCAMPVTGALRTIRLTGLLLRISQINLPSALQGVRVPVQYFIQIIHNVSMSV